MWLCRRRSCDHHATTRACTAGLTCGDPLSGRQVRPRSTKGIVSRCHCGHSTSKIAAAAMRILLSQIDGTSTGAAAESAAAFRRLATHRESRWRGRRGSAHHRPPPPTCSMSWWVSDSARTLKTLAGADARLRCALVRFRRNADGQWSTVARHSGLAVRAPPYRPLTLGFSRYLTVWPAVRSQGRGRFFGSLGERGKGPATDGVARRGTTAAPRCRGAASRLLRGHRAVCQQLLIGPR